MAVLEDHKPRRLNPQNLSGEIKRGLQETGCRQRSELLHASGKAQTLNSYLDSVLNGEFTITPSTAVCG